MIRATIILVCLNIVLGCGKKSQSNPNPPTKPEPVSEVNPPLGKSAAGNESKAENKKAGTVLWEFETGDEVLSSPVVGIKNTLYIGSNDNKYYALDCISGKKKWEFKTGQFLGTTYAFPSITTNETVIVGTIDGHIYALNENNGAKQWKSEVDDGGAALIAVGADGTLYVGLTILYALDSKTGLKKWGYEAESSVTASLSIGANGTIYIGTENGKVYGLDGKTGFKKWEFEAGSMVGSSPAIGVSQWCQPSKAQLSWRTKCLIGCVCKIS